MKGFGDRIIKAREKIGLNQKQLASRLSITPTRLNYWEKDKREPDLLMFSKIVKILDVDANELLGLKNKYAHSEIVKYKELNMIGQQKADDYIDDLIENPKYTKTEEKKISLADIGTIAAYGGEGTRPRKHKPPKIIE